MDDGYLFFNVTPVEVGIEGDSIDLEIRIYEGAQASIDRIIIEGNTKTHEHVIRRVIRTVPGQKFSRADVIRTQREIATLGFFDPEKIGISPLPHPESGTVDIIYSVEEKPSDQVELSAGFGAGTGVIGSAGIRLTNFSARNLLNPRSWHPIPSGDGQVLSFRAQSNGRFYQSYNISFTEPWLGGRKPNSLSVGLFRSGYSNGYEKTDELYGKLITNGASLGLGKQLQWPDDFFTLISTIGLQNYTLQNWTQSDFFITDGTANSISLKEAFGRNSVGPDYNFPRYGSNVTLSVQLTPPYSLFSGKDYSTLSDQEKYKWVEFHKWRFVAEWYTPVFGKFVVKTSAKTGFLGYYNKDIGVSPFERFNVGGDGLSQTYTLYGVDIISQRGYDQYAKGANIFNKYTAEIRYPFSTNPSAFVYGLAFVEAGNAWTGFRNYNPFELKRAAGLGLRVFLPIFGTVGFDYGIGFDKDAPATKSVGTYIKDHGKFSIVLGFEPE
jgi:outer membrane protein insertion porin family